MNKKSKRFKITYFSYRDYQAWIEIKDPQGVIFEGCLTRQQKSPKISAMRKVG